MASKKVKHQQLPCPQPSSHHFFSAVVEKCAIDINMFDEQQHLLLDKAFSSKSLFIIKTGNYFSIAHLFSLKVFTRMWQVMPTSSHH